MTDDLHVRVNEDTHAYLVQLVQKGTHGKNPSQVARTLIEIGVRDAFEKGYFDTIVDGIFDAAPRSRP